MRNPLLLLLLLPVLLLLALSAPAAASSSCPLPQSAPSMTMPDEQAAASASAAAPPGTCAAIGVEEDGDDEMAIEEERFAGLDNPSIVVSADTPLLRVPVLSLRPTQLAVGMHSVGIKAAKVAKKRGQGGEAALDAWLRSHPIPVVRSPPDEESDGNGDNSPAEPPLYLIDHHHLAAALHSLGVKECYAAVVRDYSSLPPSKQAEFWRAMRRDGCLWPHDANGKEVAWEDLPRALPRSVGDLKDDPYRSLAGMVRRAGGFEKSARPFAEFVWANHLRGRVPLPSQQQQQQQEAATAQTNGASAPSAVLDVSPFVPLALAHASKRDAEGLPGYTAA